MRTPIKKLTSWSYSRYAKWRDCPAAAKYKFIDKLPEPPSDAMARGDKIHKLAEAYVKGEEKKLPGELKLFKDQFMELKKSKPQVEEMWCFSKDWVQVAWNDWNNVWCRIKTDASCLDEDTLYVIDHKTGKLRDGYDDQLGLYAVGGRLVFPTIKKIITQMWFLDSGDVVEKTYTADEAKKLQKDWDKRVEPMLNDTRFSPKPGNACRWCHFSKSKGGPCKF